MKNSQQIVLMLDETPLQVELPPFFADYTIRLQDYVELKRSFGDMFDAYVRSDSYKSRDWDGEHAPDIFMYFNELLDNLFIAQQSRPNISITIGSN